MFSISEDSLMFKSRSERPKVAGAGAIGTGLCVAARCRRG